MYVTIHLYTHNTNMYKHCDLKLSYVQMYTYTHIQTDKDQFSHTQTHTQIHTHTHTHTHTHALYSLIIFGINCSSITRFIRLSFDLKNAQF